MHFVYPLGCARIRKWQIRVKKFKKGEDYWVNIEHASQNDLLVYLIDLGGKILARTVCKVEGKSGKSLERILGIRERIVKKIGF